MKKLVLLLALVSGAVSAADVCIIFDNYGNTAHDLISCSGDENSTILNDTTVATKMAELLGNGYELSSSSSTRITTKHVLVKR